MQQVKVRLIASVAGIDPATGKDFRFGKGAEVEITPKLFKALGSSAIYLGVATGEKDSKTEMPKATRLKKPVKKKATKRKLRKNNGIYSNSRTNGRAANISRSKVVFKRRANYK